MFDYDHKRLKQLGAALQRLAHPAKRITSLQFFTDAEVAGLRMAAKQQEFRRAQGAINYQGRSTFQDFDVCFPAPREGVFDNLATYLETSLWAAGQALPQNPFAQPFRLEDFAIQKYPAGSRGIGIHRDGQRYHHIVIIICLDGSSRLFGCEDRSGRGKRTIDDRPGRMVLLSAPGFSNRTGEDARPLHGVDRVAQGRLSLGFRATPAISI
ncbi:hypothetical protein [Candidatus Puniceispirillum marinum]|uniref:Fe2OG dioxygenase domain-containing protein n=1 Tax=Puniceispirillum marinum (strain IMCC1322) TaxID=488538 RepID=D5BR97_PUNMI|nr:hypothetical protein [Candidatus Puniceispirillum marinum]ADE38794.1 hypothetical protein SAR116_0551 [Candidatus Puniceispirillum marinum IMCC1322]